jgi:hypothetical protein
MKNTLRWIIFLVLGMVLASMLDAPTPAYARSQEKVDRLIIAFHDLLEVYEGTGLSSTEKYQLRRVRDEVDRLHKEAK